MAIGLFQGKQLGSHCSQVAHKGRNWRKVTWLLPSGPVIQLSFHNRILPVAFSRGESRAKVLRVDLLHFHI